MSIQSHANMKIVIMLRFDLSSSDRCAHALGGCFSFIGTFGNCYNYQPHGRNVLACPTWLKINRNVKIIESKIYEVIGGVSGGL